MRKWIIVITLLIVAGFGWWIWSLGSTPTSSDQASVSAASGVTLSDVSGDVQVQLPGQGWSKASENQDVPVTSHVKTGDQSSVTVNWFDTGETRLGAQAELEITQASQSDLEAGTVIHARLIAGRIWTRMLRLLDLDSEMSVETSDVIATVRGTAFDMEATTSTNIWVSDSVVDVQDKSVPSGVQTGLWSVPEGQMIRVGKGLKTAGASMIPAESQEKNWFKQNKDKDQKFIDKHVNNWKKQGEALGLDESDAKYALRQWSGQLHEKLAKKGDKKKNQAINILSEFGRIRVLVDQNKAGNALQVLTQLQNNVSEAMNQGTIDQESVRFALQRAHLLFEHVSPDTPDYRIRQRLEDWIGSVSTNPDEQMFDRLSLVASQADEASQALENNDLEQATMSVQTADTGLQNIVRDEQGKSLPDAKKQARLQAYMHALQVRIDALKQRLSQADEAQPEPTTASTTIMLPITTSTEPLKKSDLKALLKAGIIPSTTSATVAPNTISAQPICMDIAVMLQPNPILVGEAGVVNVKAIMSDKTTQDVPLKATYQLGGPIASVQGNSLVGQSPGSAQLTVSYDCSGKLIQKNILVQVIAAAPHIVSYTVTANPSTVHMGGTAMVTATAVSSDGTQGDQSSQSRWTVSQMDLGALRSNTFVAFQTPGTVTITASFVDAQGKVWNSSTNVSIVR